MNPVRCNLKAHVSDSPARKSSWYTKNSLYWALTERWFFSTLIFLQLSEDRPNATYSESCRRNKQILQSRSRRFSLFVLNIKSTSETGRTNIKTRLPCLCLGPIIKLWPSSGTSLPKVNYHLLGIKRGYPIILGIIGKSIFLFWALLRL